LYFFIYLYFFLLLIITTYTNITLHTHNKYMATRRKKLNCYFAQVPTYYFDQYVGIKI